MSKNINTMVNNIESKSDENVTNLLRQYEKMSIQEKFKFHTEIKKEVSKEINK